LLLCAYQGKEVLLCLGLAVNDMVADSEEFTRHVCLSFKRHVAGDCGDVCDEDRVANEMALRQGDRLFSVYKKEGLTKI